MLTVAELIALEAARESAEPDLASAAKKCLALGEVIVHQPMMYCAEKENPITGWNVGTDRVCGWCAGCQLDRLLDEGGDDDR